MMEGTVQPLHRGFQQARRLLWWQEALLIIARSLCASLAMALVGCLLAGWRVQDPIPRWFWSASGFTLVLGLAAALALRPSASRAARIVDLRLGLHQQLGTAEELLATGRQGGLASVQVASASELARELEIAKAFPMMPKREVTAAAILAIATTAAATLLALGVVLPNPLSAIHLPSLFGELSDRAGTDPFASAQDESHPRAASPAVDQVNQMLDQIQRQVQQGGLSATAASAALAQASTELNRVAVESRNRQEALDRLAAALQGTAAGKEAARSLQQGDYSQAAQEIRKMGEESDQLSPAAKQELADALRSAASESKDPQLASSETNAADRFSQGGYSSVVDSTRDLAQAVQKAADQRVSQGDLAQTWQRLQQLNRQLGQGEPQNGRSGIAPPVAQGPRGADQRKTGIPQAGRPAQAQQGGQGSEQGMGLGPPQAGGNDNGSGAQRGSGAPGTSPGGPPLGEVNPGLGPDGNPLDVEGQMAGPFPGDSQDSAEPPSIVRQGTGAASPSDVGGGTGGPLSVPAENVFVPGDRRPTVRDYFSNGSGER